MADEAGILREIPCLQVNSSSVIDRTINLDSFISAKEENHFKEFGKEKFSKLHDETLSLLFGVKKALKKKKTNLGINTLAQKIEQLLKKLPFYCSSIEYSSMCKMLACLYFAQNKEAEGISYLTASHATCLRQQIFYRNAKKKIRSDELNEPVIEGLCHDLDTCTSVPWNPAKLKQILEILPTRWHIVQITAAPDYVNEERKRVQNEQGMFSLRPMHAIHISVLPTGKNSLQPLCITLPKPNSDSYDIRKDIESLLNSNKADLSAFYANNEKYWKMRDRQNERMSKAIAELEFSWLREWRILLLADYIENEKLVTEVESMIDKLINDEKSKLENRSIWLLKRIALGSPFLSPSEIERAVFYILPTQPKLLKNIVLSIIAKSKMLSSFVNMKRKPLILIVDECLDHLSFESMTFLKSQAVTRIPSLHVANALYEEHKNTITDGYKVISLSDYLGSFIINPSLDLSKMELRMKAFISYWLPQWTGQYGTKLESDNFKKCLTDNDIVMYCGHGSGMQFLKGEEIEKIRVKATPLLFGCGSIKLMPLGGRYQTYGISNQYLIACSPCMLGTLWEVTDADIDLLTVTFMSKWLPSNAKLPWKYIDEKVWQRGKITFTKTDNPEKAENETNMLWALAQSKEVCKQFMTAAAVVVRGLPIKLV